MFGLIYLDEESRRTIEESNRWMERFLERCKEAEKEKAAQERKAKRLARRSGNIRLNVNKIR